MKTNHLSQNQDSVLSGKKQTKLIQVKIKFYWIKNKTHPSKNGNSRAKKQKRYVITLHVLMISAKESIKARSL